MEARRAPFSVTHRSGWLLIALTEWRRAFSRSAAGGGSGRRDFLWLSLLLSLTLIFALLLWGSRRGLTVQFMNVSLGNVAGAGVPIWVLADIGGIEGSAIDPELVRRIAGLGIRDLAAHPYREIEYEVRLPDYREDPKNRCWQERGTGFNGRAVSEHDPLWIQSGVSPPRADPGEIPLEVVLNRSLFETHFRCSAYTRALSQQLPSAFLPTVEPLRPEETGDSRLDCLSSGSIWLRVKVGLHDELVPFRIRWTDQIATTEKVAFLFPRVTFDVLKLAQANADLRFFPEGYGSGVERVAELLLWEIKKDSSLDERLEDFLRCLSRAQRNERRIQLQIPESPEKVRACGKEHEIDIRFSGTLTPLPLLSVSEMQSGHSFSVTDEGRLRVPCEPLTQVWQRHLGCSGKEHVEVESTNIHGGFQSALVYVPHHSNLIEAVERLGEIEIAGPEDSDEDRPALYIHPLYQDGLTRFGFMSAVINLLASYYGMFFLIFLLILLWIQVGIVITHRRHHYGVLLAKGMTRREILLMVATQISLSHLAGFAGAGACFLGVRYLLGRGLNEILTSEDFAAHIFSNLEILPLSAGDFLLMYLGSLLAAYLMVSLLLLLLWPVRTVEPAALLYS